MSRKDVFMDMIRKIFAVVVLLSLVYCANAVERRIYPCHRLAQAPVIDGKLDDEAWQNIPEATGFYIYGGLEQYAVEKQTYFKAGWADDAIYLAVRAEENAPEKIFARLEDGGDLWLDDSMELFFFPAGAPHYTHLVANSAGKRFNERRMEFADVMNWDAKASVGKTEWFLELRIPFSVLVGIPPKEGDEWPANVARNIFTGPLDERHTSWPFLKKGFHDVPNFGRFIFKGTAGDKVIDEEKEINRAYIQYVHESIRELARYAEEYEQELAGMKKLVSGNDEAEKLLSIWKQVVKLAAQTAPDCRELMPVSRACVNLPQRSDDCVARGMMEILFKE